MDTRRGLLNIGSSIASRFVLLLAALYVRRLLIVYIGNEVNGLNSLYASIIGLLSVAELGVGSAIAFSMYKPIVENDEEKTAALYCLYRKLYRIIGMIIFIAGIFVMPFIPRLISDYETLDVNVYSTFFLTLLSVVLSYLYSAKTSLIEAHKNNYITTGIITVSRMTRYLLQIAVIIIWKSYTAYLICMIIDTILVWCLTDSVVKRMYPAVIKMNSSLDISTKAEITKNIRAMFMHKIGSTMVGAIDSLIIATFLGVSILGKYTNYTVVSGAIAGFIALFFTPLTSVTGHLCASGTKDEISKYFNYLFSLNFILGMVSFLGYYAVIDNLVAILFAKGLAMPRSVSFVITLNTFVVHFRYSQLLFRDASGTFYYDRWKPVAEGSVNLILSVILVKSLPSEYGVVGVIAATIITTLLICDIVEPHIVFKYVLKQRAKTFYLRNYSYILLFAAGLVIEEKMIVRCRSNIAELCVNGAMSVALSMILILMLCLIDRSFGTQCRTIATKGLEWIRKRIEIIRV